MQPESRRLLSALPLRLTLGTIEALAAGGQDCLGRVAWLCRQISAAKEKELRAGLRQDRFRQAVVKDIERLP